MALIKQGLLSLQGRDFREECYRLLKENHVITLEEYEQVESDHAAYNALGGNHNGDHLYELVKHKVEGNLFE